MPKIGLEIITEIAAEELARIIANGHPPFENGKVACDKVSCEQCWQAWLTTGKPPIPSKK